MSKLHLDYSEYKELVGDNGVTEWTKYNWLSTEDAVAKINLGDVSWNKTSVFFFALDDIKAYGKGICDVFPVSDSWHPLTGVDYIETRNDGVVYMRYTQDSKYANMTDAQFKQAMKDVYFIYELKEVL